MDNSLGDWNRTNTIKAYSATIIITNQTKTSFHFSFAGSFGANTGEFNVTATITDKDTAEFECVADYDETIFAKV